MEHTEQEKQAFKESFKARRRRQVLLAGAILVPVVLVVLTRGRAAPFGLPPEIFGPIFFGIVALAVFFSLLNWRCPACNAYLGKGLSPRFCPSCGVGLQ